MLRRSVIAATATILVAVFAIPAAAQDQPEVVGIQLVSHPDQQGMGRRGVASIVAEAQPGTLIEREVIVSNDTRDAQRIQVYVEDAAIDESGFVPADGEGDLAGWSTTSPAVMELAPGERRPVGVRIEAPDHATNGERYGVVWAQPPASGGEVSRVNRVGIRIYLNVSGGAAADPVSVTDFVIDSMAADTLADGRRQIRAAVTNAGDRAIDLVGELELLDGPGGLRAGPFPTDAVTTLGVGGSGIVTVTMGEAVPAGPWLARLELMSGAVERAAEAAVVFPATADQPPDEVVAQMTPIERQRQVLIPIASTLVVTLLTVALVLLLGRPRKPARTGRASSEVREELTVGSSGPT